MTAREARDMAEFIRTVVKLAEIVSDLQGRVEALEPVRPGKEAA